ncbi:MAG: DUF924 domain-containing protein [Devosiaceae bacterium]|nr:DUF924 domain-containing protein [Devosiaceae bacterium MH13]
MSTSHSAHAIAREAEAFDLLEAWWGLGEQGWFVQSDDTDAMLKAKFSALVADARAGALDAWKAAPHTSLALILCLDQLPRNLFRGTPEAFASDAAAVALADEARAKRFDKAYHGMVRGFFYLPYMHAEDLELQDLCCDLYRQSGNQNAYYYALVHMDAIRRFGRFPHRNAMLGRETTAAEQAYMDSGGFAA